jgi:UDP-N-acetylmuramate dehydrogenase
MQKLWIVAKANHPGDDQNSGRVFKNPHGVRAADLIEQLGLKGHRVGRAVLSERHANFVVADPGCGTQDVLDLIELVRIRVNDELGIELENEIDVW